MVGICNAFEKCASAAGSSNAAIGFSDAAGGCCPLNVTVFHAMIATNANIPIPIIPAIFFMILSLFCVFLCFWG